MVELNQEEIQRRVEAAERARSEAFARQITTVWEEIRKIETPFVQAAAIVLACVLGVLFLTGCVVGRSGDGWFVTPPSGKLVLDTPCGQATFESSQDISSPGFACEFSTDRDGASHFQITGGAGAVEGQAATARAIGAVAGEAVKAGVQAATGRK